MRRRLRSLALVAAVPPLPPLTAADLAEIRARGTLRALVSADESPEAFSFKAGGPPGSTASCSRASRASTTSVWRPCR